MQSDLVERAQRGDAEAFEALVYGCVDRLDAIAQRILRDPDRAEDALQQALIHIWEDLPSLRDPERASERTSGGCLEPWPAASRRPPRDRSVERRCRPIASFDPLASRPYPLRNPVA